MINPFMHSNQVNLTGIVEITADIIKLILNENNETTIADIKELCVRYQNISTVVETQVPIGGGLYYTEYSFPNPSDSNICGELSLMTYLDNTFRRNDDNSIINKYYSIKKKHLNIDNETLITR